MKKYFKDRMWKKERSGNSLSESFSSIEVPKDVGFWKKFLAFVGPGLMVAVGYMDPGNWATGIAGGAKFGYTLLSVILISNLFAMLLQHLSLKLGIVAERDLAQACRDSYSRPVNFLLWIFAEIAIAATDLAEVIGAAIALNLLFGIPLTIGIAITVVDVFVILMLQAKGFRWLESVVGGLIAIIFFCFLYEIVVSNPEWFPILKGLVPQKEIVFNPSMLYIAIGILGATVMPHNLYLHSSIVQTRNYSRDDKGKREAIKFATLDSNISLLLAFLINAAILIISSAAFHHTGYQDVADITDAHQLLSPILGTSLASIVFAIALLASGQNSTLTGTLAGQIVMEGFLNIKLKPWLRRLITRLIAVIPALIVATIYGEKRTTDLLILSQVILSLQLSFAVVPLVMLTNNKLKMGVFANQGFLKYTAIIISFIIVVLNIYLVYTEIV
ncbi:Nramp family divalent metal transporter [Riemerella anatipestifer]|nr:Nramp family divalent metal transporter [Riemerella anatipestifer]MCO7331007.1 Nramp family divalent metal transporter [Riemerella anatipestifer]MCO7349943.1 Nramp family divalent metal transporter [Riemerella anatipestifer]MCU7581682.1 Nramp family divalent metal transporter [Riemerella anatipestifer]MCW0486042.1 Nramp family divalent metal transporter [Riemerella anatipestifer]MDD1548604.1 divalent metal cation transporter [Riemerella anatipestifer]